MAKAILKNTTSESGKTVTRRLALTMTASAAAIAALPALAAPPATVTNLLASDTSIPAMCAAILKLDAEISADHGPETAAYEARQAERLDTGGSVEARLVSTYSTTAADLVAKAALYERDPDRFSDAVTDAAMSLGESISRDVLQLFGGGRTLTAI